MEKLNLESFSDEQLVKFIQNKSFIEKESAFEIIVNRHKVKLYNIIFNYIKNYATKNDAEELLIQTFENFWFSINKFKFKSTVYTYLYKITINLCATYTKYNIKKIKSIVSIENSEVEKKSEEQNLNFFEYRDELVKTINYAIDLLPLQQKNALLLAHYENKSYAEIAQILNKSVSSVESLLFRAKQNLKKYLLKNNLLKI